MPLSIHYISFPNIGIGEMKINTNAIEIGSFKIAWYGIIITFAMVCAILYVWARFKENKLSSDDLLDLALATVVSGVIGTRLYYVIFSFEDFLVTNKGGFFANLGATLYEIIAVWDGGLGIYGGIIAGGIAAVIVAKRKKIGMLRILDFLAPAVMLAQSIGRWGNFFNAEAHGTETDIFLKMGIREDGIFTFTRYYHPTFLYESLWNIVGFLAIWLIFVKLEKTKTLHKFNGQIFYTYVIWYGIGRAWIEGLRTDSLWLIKDVIRVSQLVAILSALVAAGLMAYTFVMLYKGKENILVQRVGAKTLEPTCEAGEEVAEPKEEKADVDDAKKEETGENGEDN